MIWGFPGSSAEKESAHDAEDPSSIPWSGRYLGEGIGYPLQYSWASMVSQTLKNPPAISERPGLDPWAGKLIYFYPSLYSQNKNVTMLQDKH